MTDDSPVPIDRAPASNPIWTAWGVLGGCAMLWVLVFSLSFFHTRSAAVYTPRIASFDARQHAFLAGVTRVLVIEHYPFGLQIPSLRAGLLWRFNHRRDLVDFLGKVSFARRFGQGPGDFLLFLNTPALPVYTLLLILAAIVALRRKQYARLPSRRVLAIALGLLAGLALLSFVAAGLVSGATADFLGKFSHYLLAMANWGELLVVALIDLALTALIVRNEHGVLQLAADAPGQAWRWLRQGALLIGGIGMASAGVLGWAVETRLDRFNTLGRERTQALMELAKYKRVGAQEATVPTNGGFFTDALDFHPLFYSAGDIHRSIADLNRETGELKLRSLQARFTRQAGQVTAAFNAFNRKVEGTPFTVPYQSDFRALESKLTATIQRGVPSLDDEPLQFAALRKAAADLTTFESRLTQDQGYFQDLASRLREARQFHRQTVEVLGRETADELSLAELDDIESQARREGPPFDVRTRQIQLASEKLITATGDAATARISSLLLAGELEHARTLLAQTADRLHIRLPAQEGELARLETERKINDNVARMAGHWQMTDEDNGLSKNYRITRRLMIAAGDRPGVIVVNVSYHNLYKDGLFSKKKPIERNWGGITAVVDVDGASLELPDYTFSYQESSRADIVHRGARFRLGRSTNVIEVLDRNGRMLFRLTKI